MADSDDCGLAPANSPMGWLQRGRGAGYLWALEHPERVRDLLVSCITQDARRDRQMESRGPYYAEIALAVHLDLAPLLRHLREHDGTEDDYESLLTVETMHALAFLGSKEALSIARDYVGYGSHWSTALHGLVQLADAKEALLAGEARRALDGALPLLRTRFPDHATLVTALQRQWPDFTPWRAWAQVDTAVAAALTESEAAILSRRKPPRLAATTMTTREILAQPDLRSYRRELAVRLADEDTQLLLETASAGSGDAQAAALIALGERNEARVLQPALALVPTVPQPPKVSWLRYAILQALSGLPAGPALSSARTWYFSQNRILCRSAEKLFARHAEPEDAPTLCEGAQRALETGDDYRVCDAMDALARIPTRGPYPVVRTVYDETGYSRARAAAAAALAATDPSFPHDRAFESLWDCDETVRAVGCRHVDLSLPGAHTRVSRLATSPLGEDSVREGAAMPLAPRQQS